MAATVATAPRYYTTRAEAQAAVPKGGSLRFAKGQGYYASKQPLPKTAGVPGDLGTGGGAFSPSELAAMVRAEVQAQLAPQEAVIRGNQKTTDTEYAQRLAAIKNLSTSYAQALAGIAPQVQGAYETAGNSIADYGKGFSSGLQDQANLQGDAEKGLLATAGAPDSQAAAALGHLSLPTDALYGMRGAIPAGALAREGAAFGSAARMLPAEALGLGQQTSAGLLSQQGVDDQKSHQQLAALLATVPNLRTNAENNILKNERAQQAENLLLQKYGLQTRTEVGNLTGVDPKTGKPTFKATQAHDRKVATAQTKHQAAVDRRNRATASILTKLGNWVYTQRHQRGAVVIGHEPRMRTTTDAAGLKETQYLTPSGWVTATKPPANTIQKPIYDQHGNIPAPEYIQMQRYLTGQLTNALGAYGYSPKQIQEMVTELLGGPDPAVAEFNARLAQENAARLHGPH